MLKNYAPIIMQPDFLQPNEDIKSVYYSLDTPTLPEKLSEFENSSSVMKIIRELKNLMGIYLEISKS